MALKITWTEEAEITFDAIVVYLTQRWGEKEVRNFINRVNEVLALIEENPTLYRVSKKTGVHAAVITKHNTLYYLVKKENVELITFWDTRQSPEKLKL